MGFDLSENTVLLDFEGTRYAGAHVRARMDLPFAELKGFDSTTDLRTEWEWFQEHALVEWDLEMRGTPIPVSADLDELPRPFVRQLLKGWLDTVTGIAAPLEETSSSPEISSGSRTRKRGSRS